MNELDKKYLYLSLTRLSSVIPNNITTMLDYYNNHPDMYHIEIDDYVYCLFTYYINNNLKQGIFLVYDNDTIIADCAFMYTDINNFLTNKEVIDYISDKTDWTYLEHYTLSNYYFNYMYPAYNLTINDTGYVILYENAYVTRSYRRQHIFQTMLSIVKEYVLENISDSTYLYSIFTLDPDVACYGPDKKDEPYIYNYDIDEPIRQLNAKILSKYQYTPIKLEETNHQENDDGTKLWFSLKKEFIQLIDEDINI